MKGWLSDLNRQLSKSSTDQDVLVKTFGYSLGVHRHHPYADGNGRWHDLCQPPL